MAIWTGLTNRGAFASTFSVQTKLKRFFTGLAKRGGVRFCISLFHAGPLSLSGFPDPSLTSVCRPAFFQNRPTSKPGSFLCSIIPMPTPELARPPCRTSKRGDSRLTAVSHPGPQAACDVSSGVPLNGLSSSHYIPVGSWKIISSDKIFSRAPRFFFLATFKPL